MIVQVTMIAYKLLDSGLQIARDVESIYSGIDDVHINGEEIVLEKTVSDNKMPDFKTFKKDDKNIKQIWLLNNDFKTLKRLI